MSILRDDLDMRYGLRVALEWPNVEYPLPLATAVTLYRFFQEGLLNVLKHADVVEVSRHPAGPGTLNPGGARGRARPRCPMRAPPRPS